MQLGNLSELALIHTHRKMFGMNINMFDTCDSIGELVSFSIYIYIYR